MGRLFGTDGIRGIANKDLTCDFSLNIGIATAIVLGKNKKNIKIAIGRDTRISGNMISSSLIAGLCSIGVDVIDLGVIPTPAVSYLVKKYNAIAGIMVSASHNPSEYNGIKIFDRNGYKLPDALEDEIETIYNDVDNYKNYTNKIGRIITEYNPINDYVEHLVSSCSVKLDGLKVGIDCANGAASTTAELLFQKLQCESYIINNKPDGININDNCGSTHIERLIKYVKENKLDCGVAYDGDADRCIMIDSEGNIIDGDYTLAITSLNLKNENKLNKNTVVGTVMSNLGFIKFCQENNINFISTKVGDRYVLEEMLLKGYILGGEQSGHIIFKEYSNTGDGELTSIKILEIMKKTGKTLKQLSSVMQKYPQVLVNITVDNSKKNDFYNDDYINKEIENITNKLGTDGRVLVRPSGTEPLIRVMIEGSDKKIIEEYANELANKIQKQLN